MVQVDSVPRIELMRIRCLVVRNRRKLLIKRSARLIRKRHTRRMLPIDKALYRHAPRSHAVQLRTIHRRKVDLASRCVTPLALIRTTKSHIAQKTFANSQGKPRIKTQFHIEFRIGRKHRSHGIVSAHSLVNEVSVIHALDVTCGQAIVTHVACSRSHSLIYRRVNLLFGHTQLVRDISLNAQFLSTKAGIQISKPAVFRLRGIRPHAFILQQVRQSEIATVVIRLLHPGRRPQGICPFVTVSIATTFRHATAHTFADFTTVKEDAEAAR